MNRYFRQLPSLPVSGHESICGDALKNQQALGSQGIAQSPLYFVKHLHPQHRLPGHRRENQTGIGLTKDHPLTDPPGHPGRYRVSPGPR